MPSCRVPYSMSADMTQITAYILKSLDPLLIKLQWATEKDPQTTAQHLNAENKGKVYLHTFSDTILHNSQVWAFVH